jgi:hypothetical protein
MSSRTVGGFTYRPSTRPSKKLVVRVDGKDIHFGASDYKHYNDRTGLLPKSMEHKDKGRRANFLARTDRPTKDDPRTANYHARRILW